MLLDDGAPHRGDSRFHADQTSIQRRDRLPIRSDDAPSRPIAVFDQRGHHIAHDGGERQSSRLNVGWRTATQQVLLVWRVKRKSNAVSLASLCSGTAGK
jgi:hypothetical protein